MYQIRVYFADGKFIDHRAARFEASLLDALTSDALATKEATAKATTVALKLMRNVPDIVETVWVNPANVASVTVTYREATESGFPWEWKNNAATRILRRHSSPELVALWDSNRGVQFTPGDECPLCRELLAEFEAISREWESEMGAGRSG